MNDEQMQPLLKTWFRARKVAPTDVPNGVAQVMARLPELRQRGRWWPLPAFHRKPRTPTAPHTTDYQPSPIPASNGHAPTVIGRTQTMFSPVKAITAGALVFAIGGVLLIAQPFDQQGSVPGAEQEAAPTELPTGPARFTITDDDGLNVVATDPRMSGTLVERDFNPLEVPPSSHVSTSRSRLTNDAGAWECWLDEYGLGYGASYYGQAWCVGEGAYEGLSAIMFASSDADTHGLIYEGAPLREPPAE